MAGSDIFGGCRTKCGLLGGAALLAMLCPAVAFARADVAGAATQEASAQESAGLDEIVVTARKRQENLQDVPVAVTAMTGEDMKGAGFALIDDIHSQVPNLNISTAGGESKLRLFIRGVGQNDALAIADPGVGMYVDGVYYTRVTNLSFALNDIERVEVLRGPQGTLFGKNTIGGAINVLTRDPGPDAEFEIGAGTGSWNRRAFNGKVNVPLIADRLYARLAASYDAHDGWARNRFDGRKVMRSEELSVLAGLKLLLGDNASYTLKFNYSDTRSDGTILKSFADIQAGDDPLDFNLNLSGDAHHTSLGLTGTLEVELTSALTLKMISHFRDYEYHEEVVDYDGGPASLLDQYDQRAPFRQWGNEIQLLGNAFGDRLKWVFGAYYQHDEGFSSEYDCIVRIAPGPCSRSTFAVVYDAFQVNQKTDSLAVYAQGTLALTDRLSVTLGGRLSRDEKAGFHTLSTASGGPYLRYTGEWSDFTPKLSVEYKPSDDVLTYATYAKGYKAGQLPGRAFTEEEVRAFLLDPEKVDSYEVGIKADLFDRRLRVNAAAFHVDYTDLQIQAFATNPDGTLDFSQANAPSSRMRGLELEITAKPLAWLEFGGNLGYLDAKYTDYRVGDEDRTHLRLEHAPKYQFGLYGQASHRLANAGTLTARLDYSYIDDQFYAQSNSPGTFQKGYGVLNGRIGFLTADERLELALTGRNLTDKVYSSFAIDLFDGARAYGPERHFALDVSYRF